MGRILNSCENVLSLEKRIIFQNFFKRRPGAKKFKNIGNAQAQAPNARTAPAFDAAY